MPQLVFNVSWQKIVKKRHGDHMQSWPIIARAEAMAGISRGKQQIIYKFGEFELVSQTSRCTQQPDGECELCVEAVVRIVGASQ